jgi:hypothetical protein
MQSNKSIKSVTAAKASRNQFVNICLSTSFCSLSHTHTRARAHTHTHTHCENVASVINCDYSEGTGLVEKILIHVSILKIFPRSLLKLK